MLLARVDVHASTTMRDHAMAQLRRPTPDPDRHITASLRGISSRYATRGPGSWADGIAELRARAAGRADLLAEVAGTVWGSATAGERLYWYFRERQVVLLLDAGADPEQVPYWFAVGGEGVARSWPGT
jgi:hypothetical protein